ncbi:hypothetical protein [Aliivibrio fischeri]|uniref:hypothetical protein n=1 Tax=Aliivibrio fischeri TaxID=668 RepID=UPI0030804139
MTNYFIGTADLDLNEQERFCGLDDNVQMFRAGAEIDLLYQFSYVVDSRKILRVLMMTHLQQVLVSHHLICSILT